MTGPATLEAVRSRAEPELYPTHLLDGCETALVVFAAAFHGLQDCVHIADAGLTATCIDNDAQKLLEMRHVYPVAWEFITEDAFEYAASTPRQWDVVSVDCPTGAFVRCARIVEDWCNLARRAVVLGVGKHTPLQPPQGWAVSEKRWRSDYDGGVYWAILERA